MVHICRYTCAILAVVFGALNIAGPTRMAPTAHAQSTRSESRDDRSGESSREGRDEGRRSWRDRFRDRSSDRDRSSRDNDDDDDDRRESRRDRDDSSNRDSSSSSSSSSRSSSTSRSTSDSGINVRDMATKLVKELDKNGDSMLDVEEQGGPKSVTAKADLNKDGIVTIDELVAHNSRGSNAPSTKPATESTAANKEPAERRESFWSGGPRDRGRESNDSRSDAKASPRVFTWTGGGAQKGEDEKNLRRSYRFTPATERLPTGLPSWFKSRDANNDGQVAMSEYSRSWSSRTVAEFRRYDLNDDGIVTAKEAAAK